MQVYLVGGAVRDELLGLPVAERDWVVVGATPQALLDEGYRQVGRDFPVFLHPQSREEYALARTERKQGHGYTGFTVHCAPDVTLEDDLLRRDLTVNAIARAADGELIDPYGGQQDIADRWLRHVSDAFVEDPLRVLRTARFAARYAHLGFRVAPETQQLMQQIVNSGELRHLPVERIWTELDKTLAAEQPAVGIRVLRECGALACLLPEVDALFGVPQPPEYHPEIDTGEHTLMVLTQAAGLSADTAVRFAALLHDIGKGSTPAHEWPRHIAHEHRGAPMVEALCKRLHTPNRHRELAKVVCEQHLNCHRAMALKGSTLLQLLETTGALRQPQRFDAFLLACEADARGRSGSESSPYPQAAYLRRARDCANAITARDFADQNLQGPAIGEAIRSARISALEALRHAK